MSPTVAFQVQDILGILSKGNRILDDEDKPHKSDSEKEETKTDIQWTDNTQS
jgi:hypothetical protein